MDDIDKTQGTAGAGQEGLNGDGPEGAIDGAPVGLHPEFATGQIVSVVMGMYAGNTGTVVSSERNGGKWRHTVYVAPIGMLTLPAEHLKAAR